MKEKIIMLILYKKFLQIGKENKIIIIIFIFKLE